MVMALIFVLIIGFLAIAGTIVMRLGFSTGTALGQPIKAEQLSLPSGAEITALGRGAGTLLITVRDVDGGETLRVHDGASGALISETTIVRD